MKILTGTEAGFVLSDAHGPLRQRNLNNEAAKLSNCNMPLFTRPCPRPQARSVAVLLAMFAARLAITWLYWLYWRLSTLLHVVLQSCLQRRMNQSWDLSDETSAMSFSMILSLLAICLSFLSTCSQGRHRSTPIKTLLQ